jgi:hypothetical protein
LSDAVKSGDRDVARKVMQFEAGRQDAAEAKAMEQGEGDGAHNLSGDDKAGVISRGDYGRLPDSSL